MKRASFRERGDDGRRRMAPLPWVRRTQSAGRARYKKKRQDLGEGERRGGGGVEESVGWPDGCGTKGRTQWTGRPMRLATEVNPSR